MNFDLSKAIPERLEVRNGVQYIIARLPEDAKIANISSVIDVDSDTDTDIDVVISVKQEMKTLEQEMDKLVKQYNKLPCGRNNLQATFGTNANYSRSKRIQNIKEHYDQQIGLLEKMNILGDKYHALQEKLPKPNSTYDTPFEQGAIIGKKRPRSS
jgi:hypothetical protein